MLEGICHCGAVTWTMFQKPERATVCNCTICRRYGVIWAYGHVGEAVVTSGETSSYQPDNYLAFHSCSHCQCVTFWEALTPDENGRTRIGVNLRMAEPGAISDLPVKRLDGLDTWEVLSDGDRCVGSFLF